MTRRPRSFAAERWILATILLVSFLNAGNRALEYVRMNLVMDDAYMFLRYSRHFLTGLGHAWNPDGIQVYGNTSLLHFALVTGIAAAAPAASETSIVLAASILPGMVAVVLLFFLAPRLFESSWLRPRRWRVAAILLPLVILPRLWSLHLTSGMDTMTSLAALTLLVVVTISAHRRSTGPGLVVVAAYAAFLARPDNGIYCVLFPPLYSLFLSRRVDRAAWATKYLLALGATLSLDATGKYFVFGDPVPLAFYPKASGYLGNYAGLAQWNPFTYIRELALATWLFLVVIVASARWRLALVFLLPVGITAAYYSTVVQLMGTGARFYYPALPFIVVCAILAGDDALAAPRRDAAHLARRTVLLFALPATYALTGTAEAAWLRNARALVRCTCMRTATTPCRLSRFRLSTISSWPDR